MFRNELRVIVPRKIMLERKLKSYFTGQPCSNGHIVDRWADGHCVACHQKTSAEWFQNTKDRRKEVRLAYNEDWRIRNPEKHRAHKNHANTIRRRLIGGQLIAEQYSKEIRLFYENCPVGFHVDHKVPIKSDIVCGLHVPWNLQYLPAEDNIKKGNKHEV